MLYSILQIIAFQALFLMVYDLFLKRETFFNYNRAYLIITSILSLVLPFIKLPELKTIATKDLVIHLPEVFIGVKTPTIYDIQIAEQAGIILEQPQTPIWQSVAIIGIAISTLIFIIKITKLYWLKFQNPKHWQGNVLIVNLIKSSAAFSFFNTIFLGERIPETEKPTIYKHELVHIKEYHTLDLLFFELLRILLWFNPLVYIYQSRIKELHEYIADAKAVKQSGKAEYYTSLLNQVLDVNHVSFTNTFFKKSLIKKRIAMLQKTKSKQLNLIKYVLLIPMVFAMLIYSSTEVRAQQKTVVNQEFNQELTDAELIKKYYDEFVAMEKNGSTFFEISDSANYKDLGLKYIPSRLEFLKTKAYLQYISDGIIKFKSEKGTLTQRDLDIVDFAKVKHKTYEEFKAWKNTNEAKRLWESNTRDGILKLYVEDFGNKTEEEQKRYDALMKQLETDSEFKRLVVVDSSSRVIINSSNHSMSITEVEESVEVPFAEVEEVPTLPECKDLPTNIERKNCISMVVNKHIGKNFKTSIAESLSPGKKRIYVQFKIDTDGTVKDILARGPSVELEQEAKRVLSTLPQFIPGKQKGKVVVVPFSIPIVFEVAGDNVEQKPKTYEELVAMRDRVLKNSNNDNPAVIELNKQMQALKEMQKVSDSLYLKKLKEREEASIKNELDNKENSSSRISFNQADVVPLHPDCNSDASAEDKKNCLVSTINKHVGKNFNKDLANYLELPSGKQRISCEFVIDIEGNVTNVIVTGPHPKLEEEANRVIKLLPQFTPGMYKGKAVAVPYSLPIVFEIAATKKE